MSLKNTTLFALLTASSTLAQTNREIVWGSVVVNYHSEKAPFLAFGDSHLTPLGASQAFNAGTVIRNRYLVPNNSSSITEFHPINGLTRNVLVNSQLDVLTTDEEYMFGSASAFIQGLYPPKGSDGPPPRTEEHWNASGANLIEFPLNGYQYPNIKSVNLGNSRSIAIAGQDACDGYSVATRQVQITPEYQARVDATRDFYNGLRRTVFQDIPAGTGVDYRAASELYEYALYEYNHNTTLSRSSNFTANDLARLQSLAAEQQFLLNTANSVGLISGIAGRTLAGKVLERFNRIIALEAKTWKLSLLFTSFEPFISFFGASGLNSQSSPSDATFQNLPAHGSMMVFEIFSDSTVEEWPAEADLKVRFFFRNGTADKANLQEYPLFGHGPSGSVILWTQFRDSITNFAVLTTNHWCRVCQSQTSFCAPLNQIIITGPGSPSVAQGDRRRVLSPAVYGVIGAVLVVAFLFIALILLALFGFRLQRHEKNKNNRNSDLAQLRVSNGAGGFKGAEKLASDTDLTVKGGAGATVIRHERVGSWELNDAPKSPTSLDKDIESGRVRSMADYGHRRSEELDGVNPFADPVKPRDHV